MYIKVSKIIPGRGGGLLLSFLFTKGMLTKPPRQFPWWCPSLSTQNERDTLQSVVWTSLVKRGLDVARLSIATSIRVVIIQIILLAIFVFLGGQELEELDQTKAHWHYP